ncbi:MAG TPA: DUF3087 family protein [Marinagarivorans sp.]
MKVVDINKARYRSHVKKVIAGCIVFLTVGSLGLSQALIAVFPAEQGTHFHWNLLGVVVTALTLLALLIKYKRHPFMTEVTYVWELKQAMNLVIRKMRKLKQASEAGDERAMQALQFYFDAARQLAHLDDNVITLEHLAEEQRQLRSQAASVGVNLDARCYRKEHLHDF